MTIQLTNGHWQNANGDRCEVALLNGIWVAIWDGQRQSHHLETGESISRSPDNFDFEITATFEGWLSNPFDGAPEWAEWACINRNEVIVRSDIKQIWSGILDTWHTPYGLKSRVAMEPLTIKYIGNPANSLTSKDEWKEREK